MTFLSSPERARWALLHLVVLLLFLCLLPGARAVSLNGAVDNTSLTFTTPTGYWVPEEGTTAKDGVDSLTGQGIGGQVAELRTTVQGPGWLVFWSYMVSGSGSTLVVDGVTVTNLYNVINWSHDGVQLSAGSHQVIWRVPANNTLRLDMISLSSDLTRPLTAVLPGWTWMN